MDHTEAIQGSYVEKYLLGELNPAERDSFENHYFDCSICADDVYTGAVFVENARSLLRSEEAAVPARPNFPGFGLPFRAAALASVCLLAFVGYQNIVTIPSLQSGGGGGGTAHAVPRVSLVGMGSRAASRAVTLLARKNVSIDIEIPGGPEFISYECRIVDAADHVKSVVLVSAEMAKDAFALEIPGSELTPGAYRLVVVGNKSGGMQKILNSIALSVK
jgi:hypothetical protein